MKCPICKQDSLSPIFLEKNLPGSRCNQCGGIYIASTNYQAWLAIERENYIESPVDKIPAEVVDRKVAKICPGCGHLMTSFKIWPELPFYLDHCGHCNGVWFDQNEWQVVDQHDFEKKLNLFFTQPWQRHLREQESRKKMDAIYLHRFGPEDYARVKEIKAWLDAHQERSALLAFLQAEDPYEV